jgi:N-acetylneuraminate lyase
MQQLLLTSLLFAGCSYASAFDRSLHPITEAMAAVYTPMKNGGLELDLDILPKYAAYIAERNITNIMPAGSNGESLSLNVAERKALAEAWAKAAKPHGIRVYMHIGSESLVDSIDLAKHAATVQGLSGILAMTPVYFKPSVESLHDFLAAVAAGAPEMPFWFYHFPDDTGVLPGAAHKFLEMADKSGKIPNLMGIKYTDYNLMDFSVCCQIGNGKYNMLYGRDEQLFPALEMGAATGVSSTIQYAPSLREVWSLYKKGDKAGALKAQEVNAALCTTFGDFEGDLNVQKNIMKMVGMDVGPSRLPKRDLEAKDYAAFEQKLRLANFIDKKAPTSIAV